VNRDPGDFEPAPGHDRLFGLRRVQGFVTREVTRSGTAAGVASELMSERDVVAKPVPDPVRARRIRDDVRRSMSANLAEGIALSHKLLPFAGVARHR
jgi:hypothetical protein